MYYYKQKKMKRIVFFVLAMPVMFLLSACGSDDGNDELPSLTDKDDVCTAMDDSKFMKWCYESYDVNGDGKVSKVEAAAVREFTPGFERPFTSIKGLEYFTGIEKLYIEGTFSEIDLSRMPNLKRLSVKANIKKIDLSKNPLIEYILIRNKNYSDSSYTLDNPTNIIIGFEKLDNPRASFYGIVRMNEINLTTSEVQLPKILIVKKLTINNSQISRYEGQTEDVTISGEVYHHYGNFPIYWQSINVIND